MSLNGIHHWQLLLSQMGLAKQNTLDLALQAHKRNSSTLPLFHPDIKRYSVKQDLNLFNNKKCVLSLYQLNETMKLKTLKT